MPKDRVLAILQQFKAAQSNPGVLLEKYYQIYPYKFKYRIIYDSNTGRVEFPTFDSFTDAIAFMRNIGSVARKDRDIRKAHPELNGSMRARAKREVQYEYSKAFYGVPPIAVGGFE